MIRLLTATLGALFCAGTLCGQTASAPAGVDPEAFPNAHLLVSCEWLAEHRMDTGLVVVDVRKPNEYAEGHVPGAVHLATSLTFDPESMGDAGTPEQIARHLGERGIDRDTRIILYDWGKSTGAARVFWNLEMYGHRSVAVLDGGFVKWKADELEVSKEAAQVEAVKYTLGEPVDCMSTKAQILADLEALAGPGEPTCVMLDSRSTREFKNGRIPGAVHIDWVRNFSEGDAPVLLSPSKLRALYADQGVTRDKRVHAY